jgi:hypothetical protein
MCLEHVVDVFTLATVFTGVHRGTWARPVPILIPVPLSLRAGGAGKENVVNVFTVASGHMYERLQKIMFLSVVKNTKARVKFW